MKYTFKNSDPTYTGDPVCNSCEHVSYCTELCTPLEEWLVANNYYKGSFSYSELTFSNEKLEYIFNSAVGKQKHDIIPLGDIHEYPSEYKMHLVHAMTSPTFFSRRQRACLWLLFYGKHKKSEIARFFGITPNCVTIYVKKAMTKLSKYIFTMSNKEESNLSNEAEQIIVCARKHCNNSWVFDITRPTKKYCTRKCYRGVHSRKRRKKVRRRPKSKGKLIICGRPGCNVTFYSKYGKKYHALACRMYVKHKGNVRTWNVPEQLKKSWKKRGVKNLYEE